LPPPQRSRRRPPRCRSTPVDTGTTHPWVEPGAAAEGAKPLPGPPTWPENPKPIGRGPSQIADVDSDDTPWATIGLALAGTGLAAGSAVAVRRTRRRSHEPGIAG
jgi:hypothetical protein